MVSDVQTNIQCRPFTPNTGICMTECCLKLVNVNTGMERLANNLHIINKKEKYDDFDTFLIVCL